jgi:hypothetical protein
VLWVRATRTDEGYHTFAVGLEGARRSVEVSAPVLLDYWQFQAAAVAQLGRPFRDQWVEDGRVTWLDVIYARWCFDDGTH